MRPLKQVLKTLLEFILSKRIHIGFLAFLTSSFYIKLIGVEDINYLIPLVSALVVWAAYNENLCTDKKEDKLGQVPHGVYPDIESRFLAIEKLYPAYYLIALTIAFFINLRTFIAAVAAVVVFSSYVQPVFRSHRQKIRLKEIFIIKNIIPALAWVLTILGIAMSYYSDYFILEYILIFVISFLAYFREEIKFDIPDMQGDRMAGIKTFPNSLGLKGTKKLIDIINYLAVILLCALLLWLVVADKLTVMINLLKVMTPLVVFFVLDDSFLYLLSDTKRKEYCNLGILWWTFLLALFLWINYPFNIIIFLILKLASTFVARRLRAPP